MSRDPFIALALASLAGVTGGRYTNVPAPDPLPNALAQISQQLRGAKQVLAVRRQQREQQMFGLLQQMLQGGPGGLGGAGGAGGSGAPLSPA